MVKTTLKFKDEMALRLKRLAERSDLTIQELIENTISSLVAEDGATHDPMVRRKAISAVGQFRSGNKDVSRKHDQYFAEACRK